MTIQQALMVASSIPLIMWVIFSTTVVAGAIAFGSGRPLLAIGISCLGSYLAMSELGLF